MSEQIPMLNNELINPMEKIITNFENVAGRITPLDVEGCARECEDCE